MSETLTCVLCDETDHDVRTALIRWRDPAFGFGAGPRCADVDRCHQRVIGRGEKWPLEDGRPEAKP